MKIIIGLGNPGAEYVGTRHNIGFEIADKLHENISAQGGQASKWEFNKKFNADISEINYKLSAESYKLILVKPQTFMNLSGNTAKAILDFYKLTPDDIIVVHDDLDIAVGKYKIAVNSSSAGHNGVQDIIDKLATKKFKRLRIGISEESADETINCKLKTHDFVLGNFTKEERKKISDIEPAILEEIKKLL